MKNFIVKVHQRGVAPYRLYVLATTSVEAARIGIATMRTPGSLTVRCNHA